MDTNITATVDPVTQFLTIVVRPEDADALFSIPSTYKAYSGSDEWDLNDAWSNGFDAALECIFKGHIPDYLTAPQDEDDDEIDVDFGPMPEQTLDGIND